MRLLATNAGGYPRIEAVPELGQLQAVIEEQIDSGLDLVTDGQIHWSDPISYLTGKLTGVDPGEPGRFFDTEVNIRRPMIRGPFAWAVPIAGRDFELAQAVSSKPVKPVLTGALTLARHCQVLDPYYRRDFARLVSDLNEALVCEVRTLAGAGATFIQFDEFALMHGCEPDELRIVKHCWRRLASAKGDAKLVINPGPGDSAPMLEELLRLPADVVALDLISNHRVADIVSYARPEKSLGLGLISGCSAELESADAIARRTEKIVRNLDVPECFLSPVTGLEGLPRERAAAKLRILSQARDMVNGSQVEVA
jgi:5-methyltetrahydropteroyltriglutamate--homocysteine methyltransferase